MQADIHESSSLFSYKISTPIDYSIPNIELTLPSSYVLFQQSKQTPLLYAAKNGHISMADYFVGLGASLDLKEAIDQVRKRKKIGKDIAPDIC